MEHHLINNFFSSQSTPNIARSLLGKRIVVRGTEPKRSVWITEVEAYVGSRDRAAHSYQNKKTFRNRAMFMAPGTVYVFSIFGHNLLNLITQPTGDPEGVLIRAGEPELGQSAMVKARHAKGINITNGPGKLAQALGIKLKFNTQFLNTGALAIDLTSARCRVPKRIRATARIGVAHKGIWSKKPLRYYVDGNPFVSKVKKRDFNWRTHGWIQPRH